MAASQLKGAHTCPIGERGPNGLTTRARVSAKNTERPQTSSKYTQKDYKYDIKQGRGSHE